MWARLERRSGRLRYAVDDSESGGGEKDADNAIPLTTDVSALDRKRANDIIASAGHFPEKYRHDGILKISQQVQDLIGDRAEFNTIMDGAWLETCPDYPQSEYESTRDSVWSGSQNRPGSKSEAVTLNGETGDFADTREAWALDGKEVPPETPGAVLCVFIGDRYIGEATQRRTAGTAESDGTAKGESLEKRRLKIEFADDLKFTLNRKYLIKGFLDQDGTSVIFGRPNAGKSFVALDMAAHVALGRSWRGQRVNQMGVLYIAAEGQEGIPARIEAWKRHHGVESIPVLTVIRRKVDLRTKDGHAREIVELIRETEAAHDFKIGWVIVDTLARSLAGGDESSSVDMGAVIDNLDSIRIGGRCHASFIHHSGKDEAKGARGHSSLLGAIDTELEVKRDRIVNDKQRDMLKQAAMGFRLEVVPLGEDAEGDAVTSCVVLPARLGADEEFSDAAIRPKTREAWEAAVLLEGETADTTIDPFADKGPWLSVDDWIATGGPAGDGWTSSRNQTFKRARKELRDAGRIELQEDGQRFRLIHGDEDSE